ncbi:hypothetical protein ACFFJX_04435 [Pseudarcicella hirudinis]
MNLPARLAKKAEVISTIGVALAMVRDTVERNIVDPGPEDILAIRKEAAEAVIKIGAVPESIEVQVEVDTRRNLVRATAFGTTELQKDQNTAKKITKDQCKAEASKSMQVDAEEVIFSAETSHLWVFSHEKIRKSFFGLFKTTQHIIRVIDQSGVIRFQRSNAKVYSTDVSRSLEVLEEVITGLTSFGDAGRSLPDVHILIGARIINLSGLADMEQALALASAELENFPGEEKIVLVASLM